jgi:hypothetical protein
MVSIQTKGYGKNRIDADENDQNGSTVEKTAAETRVSIVAIWNRMYA